MVTGVIRLIPLVVLFVIAIWLVQLAARKANRYALRRDRARIVGADRAGSYDWDRRTEQLKREVKHIGHDREQRAKGVQHRRRLSRSRGHG